MSLFRRNDPSSSGPSSGSDAPHAPSHASASSSSSAAQRRRLTHIAPGTRVTGQLTGSTELLVEGEVEGEIRVDAAVMVGADGVVKGPVSAHVVRVGGRVEGNVQATERVEVAPSGTLEGDITAPRVIIAEGAFFKGRVEMLPQEKAKQEKPQEKAPEKPQENRRGKGGEGNASNNAPNNAPKAPAAT